MYQSFPQTVYTKKENAMPRIPTMREEQPKKTPLSKRNLNLQIDDIVLLGILVILLMEESDDWLLIGLVAILLLF